MAFRGLPNIRTFGGPSAGYSSGNETVRFYDGASMLLTTSVFVDRTGRAYGGAVAPDQPGPPADAARAATAWLHAQCR